MYALFCCLLFAFSLCCAAIDLFKAYFKQARDELGSRLLDRLFDVDGSKNKWWQVGKSNLHSLLQV
jgi:hypothetical protein